MAGGGGTDWVQIRRHTGSVTLGHSPYLPGPDILSRYCWSPTCSRPRILAGPGLIFSPAQGREASLTGRVLAEVTHRNPCAHFSHWFRYRNALHHWHSYPSLPNKPPHPLRQQRSFVSLKKSIVGAEMSGDRLSLCHMVSTRQ